MFCEYCKVGDFKNLCFCKITKQPCGFVRRCTNERCWKPLDYISFCKIRKEGVIVPNGKNKVKFELNGILYVEIGEFTYEIKNPYEYTPHFVEVTKVEGFYYIKGFEPKSKEKKIEKITVEETAKR